MATVITIPGAGLPGVYNLGNFGGHLFTAEGNTVIAGSWISYGIWNAAATTDMNSLDAYLQSAPRPLIVCGHSRGGQIIYKWIRELGATSSVPTDQVLFISSGNPERKYNGRIYTRPDTYKPVYPGTGGPGVGFGLPDGGDCHGYKILDIARQYDIWADYPTDWNNTYALALISGTIHSQYSLAAHLGADGYPLNWDEWAVFEEGDVTYLTCPTFPLVPEPPMSFMAQTFGGKLAHNHRKQVAANDALKRDPAEAAYERPSPLLVPPGYR